MTVYRLQTLGELVLRAPHEDSGAAGVARSEDGGAGSSVGPAAYGDDLVGPSKGLAVLAFLAATPGHAARRSYLADLLWPEASRARARASLRQALYYVRHRAGADLLRTEGDRLHLPDDRLSVDLWELERAAADGRWRDVLRLRGGSFVPDVPGEVSGEFRAWVRSTRRRVDRCVEAAEEALGEGPAGREDPDGRSGRDPGPSSPSTPGRHDWLALAAPAAVTTVGVLVAALVG